MATPEVNPPKPPAPITSPPPRPDGVGEGAPHVVLAQPIHAGSHRRILLWAGGGAAILIAAWLGIPWVLKSLRTVSTDDAYVNGHVTFVAPRVSGQVMTVLVDDNYRVRKGELLSQLDKEPYQIAVSQ